MCRRHPNIALTPDVETMGARTASGARVAAVLADPASYAERTNSEVLGGIGGSGTSVCILRKGDDIGARLAQNPR